MATKSAKSKLYAKSVGAKLDKVFFAIAYKPVKFAPKAKIAFLQLTTFLFSLHQKLSIAKHKSMFEAKVKQLHKNAGFELNCVWVRTGACRWPCAVQAGS